MLSSKVCFLEWIVLKLIGILVWAEISLIFCWELVKMVLSNKEYNFDSNIDRWYSD